MDLPLVLAIFLKPMIFAMEIIGIAERVGLIQQKEGLLMLTETGLKRAQQEFTA